MFLHKLKELGFIKEFREFAVRGNVLDMAVGVIMGGAFGTIVKSLVDDVLMPPLGFVLGNVDFSNLYLIIRESHTASGPYASLAEAKKAGAVTINYGLFINSIISFTIVAFALFLMIRSLNKLKRQEEAPPPAPSTKECPYCFSSIALRAIRCPHCTSQL